MNSNESNDDMDGMTDDATDNATDSAADSAIDREAFAWPIAELDPIQKMRALVAGLPYVASDEALFDVSFDEFWSFIEDLESNTPRIEGLVSRLRILERDGDRLRLKSRSAFGFWEEFDVILRPGWCVMRSRSGQIGMAARPESPTQTRFFHFEGSALLGRIARPFFAWNVRQDLRRLRRLLPRQH